MVIDIQLLGLYAGLREQQNREEQEGALQTIDGLQQHLFGVSRSLARR